MGEAVETLEAMGSNLQSDSDSSARNLLAGLEHESVDVGAYATTAEDESEFEAASHILQESAEQLEAAKQLREKLESRMSESSASEAESRAAMFLQASAAEQRRLDQLRSEVERLKAKSLTIETDDVDTLPSPTHGGVSAALESVPDLTSGALDQWIEDMRLLGISETSRSSSSSCKQFAETSYGSPTGLRCGRGVASMSPKSKKELARIAEERAMEWATSTRGSPGKMSPSRGGDGKKLGLTSPVSSKKLAA